jgi:hypothetical protein
MRNELHTPWSDVITLLRFADNQDPEGYGVEPAERRELMCTFEDGVSHKEFYLSQKEGLGASASVELWRVDYEGERFAEFNGNRYRVLRSFPSSFDCLTLMLSEVVR